MTRYPTQSKEKFNVVCWTSALSNALMKKLQLQNLRSSLILRGQTESRFAADPYGRDQQNLVLWLKLVSRALLLIPAAFLFCLFVSCLRMTCVSFWCKQSSFLNSFNWYWCCVRVTFWQDYQRWNQSCTKEVANWCQLGKVWPVRLTGAILSTSCWSPRIRSR